VISALSGLGVSLYKFAFDLRILQSPPFGELSEPFKEKQVGSSAMPFKRNPIKTEKINSLGRMLAQFPRLAWDNAAHSLLERTLDDSANRRTMLPETFLICDELLHISLDIIENLQINKAAIEKNLEIYGPFAATEKVLMALTKNGADRQDMHELIRNHTMKAWDAIQEGLPNQLTKEISEDKKILTYLEKEQILDLLNASAHIGNAPQRAIQLAKDIQEKIQAS
jgi:adenylosuccinate lyase